MITPVIRRSKAGLIAALTFILAFLAIFAWIFFVSSKNPADSGESGVLLLPFALPWVGWLPEAWLGLTGAFASVVLNALIIYMVFGGLRFRKE